MDPKLIKNNLKKAKEAIKNKDINDALKLCKEVLKEDRNNYMALVFLGAALQESEQKDQAPNAFRKAIEVSPNQMLAWQGLAAFYEKESNCVKNDNLVPIYQQLLVLESECSKWCDIILKLQDVITKCTSDHYINEIVATHMSVEDTAKSNALTQLIAHYLTHANDVPADSLKLYEEVLIKSPSNLFINNCEVYLKILYKQRRTKELLDYCERLNEDNVLVARWVCKVCTEEFVDNRESVLSWCNKLPKYYNKLLDTDGCDVSALMAQAVHQMSQSAYLEARQSLLYCLLHHSNPFLVCCMLAEVEVHMLCLDEALQNASLASSQRPDHIMPKAVIAKVLSLSDDRTDWEKAAVLATEVLKEQPITIAVEGLCQASLKLGNKPELLDLLPNLKHAPELADFLRMQAEGGSDLLSALTEHTPNCPEAWYCYGQLSLQAGKADLACIAFLKCAKIAPYWYTSYLELGHLYSTQPSMLDKARRCYQQALVLRPHYRPTQEALSNTYRALDDMKSNLELLEGICKHPEGKWAMPRLGLQYSDLGHASSAINCLVSALKSNPNDSHMWEALADAYLARGANGSALKSYQKVLELSPGAFYSALQIATIKQITDLIDESLSEFRELVAQKPDSILALKGLCETNICIAKTYISSRLLGLARDRLQEGLVAVSDALHLKADLACLWKLAGDCLTLVGSLPNSWSSIQVSQILCPKAGESQTLQGIQLLELGARCICRCLKLMPDINPAPAWHDLALNYLHQVKLGGRSIAACKKAFTAAKQSVVLDPRRWQHWNILGVVATLPEVKAPALAQHAFIKATMVDDTVAEPWSNLGCLYLRHGELKLANASFNAAQRINSEYCPSWVGQALIAELVKDEETMDLFRHTTQLGYHVESCLGYAQWVCNTLHEGNKTDPLYIYSIEKMHAVPVAINCLTWATEEIEDVCGLNMLGCLLETAKLYQLSAAALGRAVDLSPASSKDKVLANFARVLFKAGKVDDAIEVYRAITKADFHSQCGLALALYRGKRYSESYEAYDAALNWLASTDIDKAHLNVAMAAVIYKMEGPEKTKALLLQGIHKKPVSVDGLLATCALGILTGDWDLTNVVLKDLDGFQDETEYIVDIAFFQAYSKFIQGDPEGSISSMSEAVHRHPDLPDLWLHLAVLMLNKQLGPTPGPPDKGTMAAQSALTAMVLGHTKMDVSKALALASLGYLLGNRIKDAMVTSQKAVHLYPTVGECWAALAASCYVANNHAPIRAILSRARQHTSMERSLAKWMSNFERKMVLISSEG